MSDDLYMDKLDEILGRIAAIEEKLEAGGVVPATPKPLPTGGLYDFVRPDPVEPRYGLGVEMTSPDVGEAKRRACYGVNWRGGQALSGQNEDDVWTEIERLKKADPELLPFYQNLDPEVAGFGLLTGLFDVTKYDGRSFGVNSSKRESYAGDSVESILLAQMAALNNGGGPSGE